MGVEVLHHCTADSDLAEARKVAMSRGLGSEQPDKVDAIIGFPLAHHLNPWHSIVLPLLLTNLLTHPLSF